MISPVAISQYTKAEDNLRCGLIRLSRVIRPELLDIKTNENSISIDFTVSNHGTSPRIRAIYGDGSSEPEVYVDRADWYNFDASDYINYFDKSEDILVKVIRSELRRALQEFLEVAQIPNTLLEFCLERDERSTLEIANRSKLYIHCFIDSYQILYDIGPGNRVGLTITDVEHAEAPPFSRSFPMTELTSVVGFAKHLIGTMEDAMHLGDEVIRKVTNIYATAKCSAHFPCAEFFLKERTFRVELTSDYANIQISCNGIAETFPIGNLDFEAMKRRIFAITTQ